jgi:hypothetical protein
MTLAPIPPPYEPDPERAKDEYETAAVDRERELDLDIRHTPFEDGSFYEWERQRRTHGGQT